MANTQIDKNETVAKARENSDTHVGTANARKTTFDTVQSNKEWHKSFDFSNVGLWQNPLRHFHQMKLFIVTSNLFRHSSNTPTTGTAVITANLPEQFNYSIASQWGEPLSQFGSGLLNLAAQTVGQSLEKSIDSAVNRVMTFKIWQNTKPLSLDLKIPVIDDNADSDETGEGMQTNLVEALEFLGTLVLPQYDDSNTLGFYTPPPSPLNLSLRIGTGIDKGEIKTSTFNIHTAQYARIMLQLGGILLVDNCIIESVSVSYPNTKTMIAHSYKTGEYWSDNIQKSDDAKKYLHPLLAEVNIRISTLEALTANTYSKMLWGKTQSDQGEASASLMTKSKTGAQMMGGILDTTFDLFQS